MSHIIDRGEGRAKLVRFEVPGLGRDASVSTGRITSRRGVDLFQRRIDALIEARLNGEPPPPPVVAWADGLPRRTVDKLAGLGLLDRRRIEGGRRLYDGDTLRTDADVRKLERAGGVVPHIDRYRLEVAARRSNSANHARRMAQAVLRLCRALDCRYIADLDAGDVLVKLGEWDVSDNTRRHYLVAMRDFTAWLRRTKRAGSDPMADVALPAADRKPAFTRRPFTVGELRALLGAMADLDAAGGRYDGQIQGWDAASRRMLYWTAALTGLRQNELRSLQRQNLEVDARPGRPAVVRLRPEQTKNGRGGVVPIPGDLAAALGDWTRAMTPAAPVFADLPASRRNVVAWLRRDLRTAGVDPDPPGEPRLDFHSFRGTAMVLWLDAGLSIRQTAERARCGPRMVERYVRWSRVGEPTDLARLPSLIQSGAPMGAPGHGKTA